MSNTTIVEVIRQFYPDVQAVYLFGSYGTQYERRDSDVDIALLLPYPQSIKNPTLTLSPCCSALEVALSRTIDLINIRMVSTVFQNEILNSARVLFNRDQDVELYFEMMVLSSYQKLNEERKDILESFFQTKRAYDV
jgi:predicted nucleotidyltransferase